MNTPYEFDDGISDEEFFAGQTPALPPLFAYSYSDETGCYDFGPDDDEFPPDDEDPNHSSDGETPGPPTQGDVPPPHASRE